MILRSACTVGQRLLGKKSFNRSKPSTLLSMAVFSSTSAASRHLSKAKAFQRILQKNQGMNSKRTNLTNFIEDFIRPPPGAKVPPLNRKEFGIVLRECSQYLCPKSVDEILQVMKARGILADVVSYNTVLQGYVKSRQWKHLDVMWKSMIEDGVKANVRTLTTMIEGYGLQGRIQNIDEIMTLMSGEDGVQPNGITYATLMKAFARKGQTDQVFHYYNEMLATGYTPTLITFNVVLLASTKHFELSRKMYDEMKRCGIKPDVTTLTALVDASARSSSSSSTVADVIFNLLDELDRFELKPDTILYNRILKAFIDSHPVTNEALQLIRRILYTYQILPDAVTFTRLLQLYILHDYSVDETVALLDEMTESFGLNPCSVRIDEVLRHSQEPEMLLDKLLDKMVVANPHTLQPQRAMYRSLIARLVHQKNYPLAWQCYQHMKQFNRQGSFTPQVVPVTVGETVYHEAKEEGNQKKRGQMVDQKTNKDEDVEDITTLNAVLKICSQLPGRSSDAMEILHHIHVQQQLQERQQREQPEQPLKRWSYKTNNLNDLNQTHYHNTNNSNTNNSSPIISRGYPNPTKVNIRHIFAVMQSLGLDGRMAEALELLNVSQETYNVAPDLEAFHGLLRMCGKEKDWNQAVAVIHRLLTQANESTATATAAAAATATADERNVERCLQPTEKTLVMLLHVMKECGRWNACVEDEDEAEALLDEYLAWIPKFRIVPTEQLYNVLLQLYACQKGNEKVQDVLEFMSKKEYHLRPFTIASMVAEYTQQQEYEQALALFETYKNQKKSEKSAFESDDSSLTWPESSRHSGSDIENHALDGNEIAVYNAVLNTFACMGDATWQSMDLYTAMQEDSLLTPDIITHNTLLKCMLNDSMLATKADDFDFLWDFVDQEMKVLDSVSITLLLQLCLRHELVDYFIENMLEIVLKRSQAVDFEAMTLLLDVILATKQRPMEAILESLVDICLEGKGGGKLQRDRLAMSSIEFSETVLNKLFKKGQYEIMEHLYTSKLRAAVFSHCQQATENLSTSMEESINQIIYLLLCMKRRQSISNSLNEKKVDAHTSDEVVRLFEDFREVLPHPLFPWSSKCFSTLVIVLEERKDFANALLYLTEMKQRRIAPTRELHLESSLGRYVYQRLLLS